MCKHSYRCCHRDCKLPLSKGALGHSFGTCTEGKPPCSCSICQQTRQSLCSWLWWCSGFTDRPGARGVRTTSWEQRLGFLLVCTPSLCIRGGITQTQGCSQDLYCPVPSQGLSAEFSEKTEMSVFKYQNTKERGMGRKELLFFTPIIHQGNSAQSAVSGCWVFLDSLLPCFPCSEMLRAALYVLS